MRRRRGWVFIDVLTAMLMVAGMIAIVAIALNRQKTALQRLADTRDAAHQTEAVLVSMQSGGSPDLSGAAWHAQTLNDAAPVAGRRWVRVTVVVNRSSCSIVGLVADRRGQP